MTIRILLLCANLFLVDLLQAQSPKFIAYQALLRDAKGIILKDTTVTLRFSVSISADQKVYSESVSIKTSTQGMASHKIGSGTVISGSFGSIDWSAGAYYLTVEVQSGQNFVNMGTTQLLRVPYAFYADKAGNAVQYKGGRGISIVADTISNALVGGAGIVINNNVIKSTFSAGKGIQISNAGQISTSPLSLLAQSEINAKKFVKGDVVYNKTSNCVQYYIDSVYYYTVCGGTCQPQVSVAEAGSSQLLNTNSTTLDATAPSVGIGEWVITSGSNGIISDIHDPKSGFTGDYGTHVLTWKVSNLCGQSTDNVIIAFSPQAVHDYDGNTYTPLVIGSQIWLTPNLKATHYADGIPIPSPGFPNNDNTNVTTFGLLYNYSDAMRGSTTEKAQGACPTGYHIPTAAEFDALIASTGGSGAGLHLESNTIGTWSSVTSNDNSSNFSLVGAGLVNSTPFQFLSSAFLWSSSSISGSQPLIYRADQGSGLVDQLQPAAWNSSDFKLSVRCVKD